MPKLKNGQESIQVIISHTAKRALERLADDASDNAERKISVGEFVRGLIQAHFDERGMDTRVDEGLKVWGSNNRKEAE